MRLPSIAGTRAAAQLCGECGHSRIRHTDGGYGRCAAVMQTRLVHSDPTMYATEPCPCGRFINTKEGV